MMAISQLDYYYRITEIARNIELEFESSDERDTLYLRLVQLLKVSNEFNSFTLPFLTITLKDMLKRETMLMNGLKTNKKLYDDWLKIWQVLFGDDSVTSSNLT